MSIRNIPVIKFVPDYLESYIVNNVELGEYDLLDAHVLNAMMYKALTGYAVCHEVDESRVSKLMDIYTTDGVYVFNEDSITINSDIVFQIIIPPTILDESLDCFEPVVILCGKGSTNLITHTSYQVRKNVTIWLVDYLVKRLGEEIVFETGFFQRYWLAK